MKTLSLLSICISLCFFSVAQQNTPKADSLIQVLKSQSKSDSSRVKTLLDLTGEVRFYDLDKALEYAQESYDLSVNLGREVDKGKSIYYLGLINYFKGFTKIAEEYMIDFLNVFEPRNDSLRISFGYNLLGVIYTEQRNDDEAIKYLIKSTELSEALDDKEGVIQGLSNIGTLYLNLNRKEKAREYFERSVKITEEVGINAVSGAPYINLAGTLDNKERKEVLYQKAKEIFEQQNYQEGLGQIIMSRGDDAYNSENYAEAIAQYRRAAEHFQQNALLLEEGNALHKVAGAYMETGQLAAAENALNKCLKLAENVSSNELKIKALEYLTTVHEQLNRSSLALADYRQLTTLKDSLENAEKATIIAENEARFRSAEREEELRLKEEELLIQESKTNQIIIWSLLALLGLGAIGGTYFYRQKKKDIQRVNELKIRELESESLREKERIKSAFFANISHEFRTPLTLIISPLKEIIQSGQSGELAKIHKTILRNGERLLALVNQLLDLSKLESGTLKLEKETTDINAYLKGLAGTFESMAAARDITFSLKSPGQPLPADFDKDKVHKIVNNLLSNAFKFTPEGGEVSMSVSAQNQQLHLQISDTGIGISEEDLPHIFERFYQSDSYKKSDLVGTGIGLALTRELVELHGGEIKVNSQQGQGSKFEVWLPVIKENVVAEPVMATISSSKNAKELAENITTETGNLPLLLVVEDNADVALLIKESLENDYQILHAENGRIGLEMAQNQIPEAIISDVMMPEMDGFEFCEKVKTDSKTAHIPVIMLTALSEQKDKMAGLETGADAYLSKPFEIHELKVRLKKLIELRQNLKASFSKLIKLKPDESELNSVDAVFVETVKNTLEGEYSNDQFNVDALANALNLSRRQLSRKFKALFDQTPIDTIRQFRLEKAHELLSKKAANPTEVAYQTGFSSPAYFSKCFSDHFGFSPSKMS